MKNYSIEQFAKYNTITVLGVLQEIYGQMFTADNVLKYYNAMLNDLRTGAMERSCDNFDAIVGNAMTHIMN